MGVSDGEWEEVSDGEGALLFSPLQASAGRLPSLSELCAKVVAVDEPLLASLERHGAGVLLLPGGGVARPSSGPRPPSSSRGRIGSPRLGSPRPSSAVSSAPSASPLSARRAAAAAPPPSLLGTGGGAGGSRGGSAGGLGGVPGGTAAAAAAARLLLSALSGSGSLSDALLHVLLRPSRCRALTLGGCTQITDAGLAALTGAASPFGIELSTHTLGRPLSAGRPLALRSLALDGLNISDAALDSVPLGCPRLTALSLVSCRRLTDAAVATLLTSLSSSLSIIDLSNCKKLGDASATSALCCGRLTKLVLDSTRASDEALQDAAAVVAEAEAAAGAGRAGRGLSGGGDAVSGGGAEASSSGCERSDGGEANSTRVRLPPLPRLTRLSLARCRLLSEDSLCALCLAAPNLRHLTLDDTAAADALVDTAATSLPRLHALSLAGCALTPAAPPLLLVGCPQLRALDFSRCARLTKLEFSHSNDTLRELRLCHVPHLTREAVAAVGESCGGLQALRCGQSG